MEKDTNADTAYPPCSHYERRQPSTRVDEEIVSTFSKDFRVLPLYEKKLFDFTRVRHYSLQRNKLLGCRWRCYVDTSSGRVRYPFQFPKVDDFHFYNYHNRYAPSQSVSRERHPRRLGLGPGVDAVGQMPIPAVLRPRRSPARLRPRANRRKF